jgi:hypothetical protein
MAAEIDLFLTQEGSLGLSIGSVAGDIMITDRVTSEAHIYDLTIPKCATLTFKDGCHVLARLGEKVELLRQRLLEGAREQAEETGHAEGDRG